MKISTFQKALILLALVIATAVPVCAFDGGDGTVSNPYRVATKLDLEAVADNPSAHYKQTANIVVNDPSYFEFEKGVIATSNGAQTWEPIQNFTGSYDGGNFYITGLYVTEDNANGGLFAEINGGTVKNLNLDFALIESDHYAGVLAGKIEGAATVEHCMTAGSVIGMTTKSMNTAGGLAGLVGEDATVTNSVSYATVTGATSYSANVGGLVGLNNGTITNCGYLGELLGTATYYDAAIGGIAGYNSGNIDNCRVAGTVGGESTAMVNDCYVGGVAGVNKGNVENCQNDAEVSVKNFSNGDSVCAAGGIVGAAFDAVVSYNTNNGVISGEYSYLGGIAGVAISDTDVHYVHYNDNTGAVTSAYGVAGGIVGRAVAAGEGYVSIKLYVENCYNSGVVSGNAYGEIVGETAAVESAQVIIGAESTSNSITCSAPTIYEIIADKVQYGTSATATTNRVSGTGTSISSRAVVDTEKFDKKIIRYNRRSTNVFLPAPVYVELVVIEDASKIQATNIDISNLNYADGKITGNVVVKVYRPEDMTNESFTVVVGTSVGNKFADVDFKTETGKDRIATVTIPVDCEATAGTITVNALIVGTTDAMDPLCENIKTTK